MVVTVEQMRQIEQNAAGLSLSMERLMENAGSAAAAAIRRMEDISGKYFTIFCGNGNNGGDGFVAARRLTEAGANAVVILTDGMPRTEQAASMYERIELMEIPIVEYGSDPDYLADRLSQTDYLVDAIYGIGFHGELDKAHRDICRLMDGVGVPVFSLDIPSGVSANTGHADPYAVHAAHTIVFDSCKPACIMPRAAEWLGNVTLADIGIPEEARQDIHPVYTRVDAPYVFRCLRPRPRECNKGTFGRLLNIAGCGRYMGAALLSTHAALRTGAGYVTLASTKEVCRNILPSLPEAVMHPLRQTLEGDISAACIDVILEAISGSSAVLIGSGLGTSSDAHRITRNVLSAAACPVVVDADGINALSRNIDMVKHLSAPLILTPHLKEFSRLSGLPVEQIKADPVSAGRRFAQEYGVTLVLKDAYTYTFSPEGETYVNTSGNAGLAKAGTGDVLAGIIAALAAQGYPCIEAAACGVWLHGAAGDDAARRLSQYGMLAHDVIDSLCAVFSANGF